MTISHLVIFIFAYDVLSFKNTQHETVLKSIFEELYKEIFSRYFAPGIANSVIRKTTLQQSLFNTVCAYRVDTSQFH